MRGCVEFDSILPIGNFSEIYNHNEDILLSWLIRVLALSTLNFGSPHQAYQSMADNSDATTCMA